MKSEKFAVKVVATGAFWRKGEDDHELKITHNGWQWSTVSLTKEELEAVRDEITRYINLFVKA
jgi:hypothetical protein